ncbi:TIGR03619 family F420-dependent LLM class oxidoreductase [Streptomyces sp. HPF1205]|uniref:TIGR03619 family F420-dependent LLM class oxidoreductase n=1 Tax=Streptomyces sp. HPF1205 TaxID=2873262 RepID=UPI001CEC8890|nr:TIGR03619 family F420-dependent LLM class oxidoreductase [Streptomyces sp. HPF1205]
MRLAATIFLTDQTITPVHVAQELEQRGFAGLYLPEHTHIPVSRATPYPAGEPLPEEYGRTLDAFAALAAAAAVTRTLELGTAITLVAQHDPIVLAKQIATLDHMSGGRFTLGVGFGWNVEEAADHGVVWARRRDLVRDHMHVMRALWSSEPAAYTGDLASVQASHAWPKPAGGTVRTLVGGGAGARTFAHVTDYGDGWMPIGGSGLAESLPRLREAWRDAGRGPDGPLVVPTAVRPTPEKLARLRDLGVEEALLQLPAGPAPEVLRVLDDYARYL